MGHSSIVGSTSDSLTMLNERDICKTSRCMHHCPIPVSDWTPKRLHPENLRTHPSQSRPHPSPTQTGSQPRLGALSASWSQSPQPSKPSPSCHCSSATSPPKALTSFRPSFFPGPFASALPLNLAFPPFPFSSPFPLPLPFRFPCGTLVEEDGPPKDWCEWFSLSRQSFAKWPASHRCDMFSSLSLGGCLRPWAQDHVEEDGNFTSR